MALVDTTLRKNQARLCTQQHRLRHLQSISACNIQTCADCVYLYFTMHLNETSPDFYASEKCTEIINPKWRNFDVSQFPEFINTSVSSFLVRIWCQHGINNHVIIEWILNLSGLQIIGEQILKNDRKYKPNTIVFRMHNFYYTDPTCLQFLSPSKPIESTEPLKSVDVERQLVRHSYSVSSLQRIHTIQRAIKQTQVSIWRIRNRINERLLDVQINEEKRAEKEHLQMFLGILRSQLQCQKMKILNQREQLSRLIGIVHDRSYDLVKCRETLRNERDNYFDTKIKNGQSRELLLKTCAELALRRKQLLSELPYIYPISETESSYGIECIKKTASKISCLSQSVEEIPDKGFTICNVHLPNSEDFVGHDETKIAAALGYVTHLVSMIAEFLDIPLRYPIRHLGSRSRVTDHIVDKIPDKERNFPLYSKGKNKIQFNYAVYLLNKNIAQLRYSCGILTPDLRVTLQNIQGIVEMDLGFRLEVQSTSSHSFSDSRSIPSSSSNLEQRVSLLTGTNRLAANDYFRLPKALPSPHSGAKPFHLRAGEDDVPNGTVLSCSLDKGLDELRVTSSNDSLRLERSPSSRSTIAHHSGSEPNLTRGHAMHLVQIESEGSPSSCEDAARSFAVGMELWGNGSSRDTASSQTNSDDDVDRDQTKVENIAFLAPVIGKR